VFFLSLEDDLMRLFGSDRISGIMQRLGVEEGEVITHGLVTKSIERAQKRVEMNNFEARKRLLDYDDVMNQQREVVYDMRLFALEGGEDLKGEIWEMIEAAARAAEEQLHEATSSIAAAEASLRRIQVLLDESTLVSPIHGRVIYRLAEPGEVIDAGGKVVTVLDLADVYMTIFLPTDQAGRVAYGAEARMVLDAYPELVLPASIEFASPEAQFTPKEVETRTEREKLMFRYKVKIDPALLEQHFEQVKTGIPGVSYVRLAGAGEWPAYLAVKLPPP
jgi:HlyD family secretion protein